MSDYPIQNTTPGKFATLRNLWREQKEIWDAIDKIGHTHFSIHDLGWHHWVFRNGALYKDGVQVPDDCSLEMWIKNPGDKEKHNG